MSETTEQGLYPAEHRALRELHATARRLADHWRRRAGRMSGTPAAVLTDGASAAEALLAELESRTAAVGIFGVPAAQGTGRGLAGLRAGASPLLERNQALRTAVLDLQHVVTLLGYLRALAETRGDAELAGWYAGWEERLGPLEARARDAVRALGRDPAGAVEPAEPGALGRAGVKITSTLGALGEAIDQSAVGRVARRRSG
jgi:hypothetical protein